MRKDVKKLLDQAEKDRIIIDDDPNLFPIAAEEMNKLVYDEVIDDFAPEKLAFTDFTNSGVIKIFLNKKIPEDYHNYLRLHEFGHILFGHTKDNVANIHFDQLKQKCLQNWDSIAQHIEFTEDDKRLTKLELANKYILPLSELFLTYAEDFEVNSKLFSSDEWQKNIEMMDYADIITALKSVPDAKDCQNLDSESKKKLESKISEITEWLNKSKGDKQHWCHPLWPEDYNMPTQRACPEYIDLIFQNLDKFMNFIRQEAQNGQPDSQQNQGQQQSQQNQQNQNMSGSGSGQQSQQQNGSGGSQSQNSSQNGQSGSQSQGSNGSQGQNSQQSLPNFGNGNPQPNARQNQQQNNQQNGSGQNQQNANQNQPQNGSNQNQQQNQQNQQNGNGQNQQQNNQQNGNGNGQQKYEKATDIGGGKGNTGTGKHTNPAMKKQQQQNGQGIPSPQQQAANEQLKKLSLQDIEDLRKQANRDDTNAQSNHSAGSAASGGSQGNDAGSAEWTGQEGMGFGHAQVKRPDVIPLGDGRELARYIEQEAFSKKMENVHSNIMYYYNRRKYGQVDIVSKETRENVYRPGNIYVIVDCSGSIDERAIKKMLNVIKQLSKKCGPKSRVIWWDTRLCKDILLREQQEPICGGGTDIGSGIIYVRDKYLKNSNDKLFIISDYYDSLGKWYREVQHIKNDVVGICWTQGKTDSKSALDFVKSCNYGSDFDAKAFLKKIKTKIVEVN